MSDVSNFPGFGFDPFKTDTLIGDIDPFIGDAQQTSRMKAYCRITVAGVDVTDQLNPHLISVRVVAGIPSTQAEIELDDRDGTLPIPPIGSQCRVELGWQTEQMTTVFQGLILDFEHGFGRKQGGRRMWVHADGANLLSSGLKEPVQDHAGEGAPPGEKEGKTTGMNEWIQQVTKHAGVNANVDGFFNAFKQDFWSAANASPMHVVNSLAEQFGFMHQFHSGDQLDVEKPGKRGVSCSAIWRVNLIGWRVRPFAARAAFGGAKQETYDAKDAVYKQFKQSFAQNLPGALGTAASQVGQQMPAATDSAAQQDNEGQQQGADSSFIGNGRIIINGEPKAQWNSYVTLKGARPGVDGQYLITQVEHVYSRQGFITTLEVLPYYGAPSGQSVLAGFLPKPAPNVG